MAQKTTLKFFFPFSIMCLFATALGFGQPIFSNTITGTAPGDDNPYTAGQIVDDNITVSGIGRGIGVIKLTNSANDRYAAKTWSTNLLLDKDDYFEFTITPNTGYEINFQAFIYESEISPEGPKEFAFRSSLDGYKDDIGTCIVTGTTIELSSDLYQNIVTSITFRIYGWNANDGRGNFSINDFTFNGVVSPVPCASTVTWTADGWDNETGPTIDDEVIIDADYNTGIDLSFSACSLTVTNNGNLNIANNTFVEVQNNVTINGTLTIETSANFVQRGSRFKGTATVNKTTNDYSDSTLHYVYWSSPVVSADLATVFPKPYLKRRYYFESANFVDVLKEDDSNNNTFTTGQDDIDDDNNAWQKAIGPMKVGHGYVIATDNSASPPYNNTQQFTGELNNGDISVPVFRNDTESTDINWILLGNPYPSAIDATPFIQKNYYNGSTGTIEGVIYLWRSEGVASAANPGFDTYNFSQTDYYELINLTGGSRGPGPGPGLIPIPSGQGFFVSYHNNGVSTSSVANITEGAVYFNNDMRIVDEISNSEFFKNSNVKRKTSSTDNKLWVKLTSDNGVFDQILIGYLSIATDNYDGEVFDASKNLSSGAATIHSIISGVDKKFAIQGKAETSLGANEIIKLGFATKIKMATLYNISIAQLQGDFLTNNTIYLKDNLLGKIHNLSEEDYTFTSEVGEFNDRFAVLFNNQTLDTDNVLADDMNTLKIIDLENNSVKFIASNNLKIKTVAIFDLLGRQLYQFNGQHSEETFNLPDLKHAMYIFKIILSNGTVISKKAIKK